MEDDLSLPDIDEFDIEEHEELFHDIPGQDESTATTPSFTEDGSLKRKTLDDTQSESSTDRKKQKSSDTNTERTPSILNCNGFDSNTMQLLRDVNATDTNKHINKDAVVSLLGLRIPKQETDNSYLETFFPSTNSSYTQIIAMPKSQRTTNEICKKLHDVMQPAIDNLHVIGTFDNLKNISIAAEWNESVTTVNFCSAIMKLQNLTSIQFDNPQPFTEQQPAYPGRTLLQTATSIIKRNVARMTDGHKHTNFVESRIAFAGCFRFNPTGDREEENAIKGTVNAEAMLNQLCTNASGKSNVFPLQEFIVTCLDEDGSGFSTIVVMAMLKHLELFSCIYGIKGHECCFHVGSKKSKWREINTLPPSHLQQAHATTFQHYSSLFKSILKVPYMTRLILDGMHIDESTFRLLKENTHCFRAMRQLCISNHSNSMQNITAEDMVYFLDQLRNTLVDLDLRHNCLRVDVTDSILSAVRSNCPPQLQTLLLDGNYLDGVSVLNTLAMIYNGSCMKDLSRFDLAEQVVEDHCAVTNRTTLMKTMVRFVRNDQFLSLDLTESTPIFHLTLDAFKWIPMLHLKCQKNFIPGADSNPKAIAYRYTHHITDKPARKPGIDHNDLNIPLGFGVGTGHGGKRDRTHEHEIEKAEKAMTYKARKISMWLYGWGVYFMSMHLNTTLRVLQFDIPNVPFPVFKRFVNGICQCPCLEILALNISNPHSMIATEFVGNNVLVVTDEIVRTRYKCPRNKDTGYQYFPRLYHIHVNDSRHYPAQSISMLHNFINQSFHAVTKFSMTCDTSPETMRTRLDVNSIISKEKLPILKTGECWEDLLSALECAFDRGSTMQHQTPKTFFSRLTRVDIVHPSVDFLTYLKEPPYKTACTSRETKCTELLRQNNVELGLVCQQGGAE